MPRTVAEKPKKPYPEFPLYSHRNGQWAKKIRGDTYFFGLWADPGAALQTYKDQVDDIQAGRDPRRVMSESVTVADIVNLFLHSLIGRREIGEISAHYFSDMQKTGKAIVAHFGRRITAWSLRAADFSRFRRAFSKKWGPAKTNAELNRTKTICKWAADADLIRLPNFGPDFKRIRKAVGRIAKAQREAAHGKLDFSADEIRILLDHCTGWMHAATLLGIHAGFGNVDCGRLQYTHVDFDSQWYDLPRQRSGIPGRFRIWPNTLTAIRAAMDERPIASEPEHDTRCFLTVRGLPVYQSRINADESVTVSDCVSKTSHKLMKTCKVTRPGRGFYSLRRTFETVAGNSRDQVAVNMVMGHADESRCAGRLPV